MLERTRSSARSRYAWLLFLAVAASSPVGCGSGQAAPKRTELSVFAASSLTEAFEALERRFEADHPEVDVALTFAGSQVLRLQLEQGAAADLFASANEAHMRALVEAGMISDSRIFAHNELAVIVPLRDPAAVQSFEDLPKARRLVIGTEHVPVGIYTRRVFDRAKRRYGEDFAIQLVHHVVSEESNVRLVRAKVELGEADAAFVYRTDAVASDNVQVVGIPDELNVKASYPIGLVSRSRHASTARRFVDFALSEQGQEVLAAHGFVTAER